jgi:glycosyltransferase involved in cell wall biosynthesis
MTGREVRADTGDDELDVTVIVPVLDGARTMPALLRNLMTQVGAPERREIIIVDNGSTDGSQAIAASTPGVTLLEAPIPGASAARNVGLRAARGRIVACLDVDAQPTRRWLAELVAGFTEPSVILVAGGVASYPPATAAQRFSRRHGLSDATRFRLDGTSLFANTRNMAVRRDAALAVGGWAEDMLRCEDVDFTIRILDAFGGAVVLRESALVFHHDRETDDELRLQAQGYGFGMALLYQRYPARYPWGWRQRWALMRRTARYVGGESAERIRAVVGRSDPDRLEQRIYDRRWHFWYFGGFFATRRGGGLPR